MSESAAPVPKPINGGAKKGRERLAPKAQRNQSDRVWMGPFGVLCECKKGKRGKDGDGDE